MRCEEVISYLSELAPFEYAEKWDNVGLLVGSFDKEIQKVYIAVDADDAAVLEACEWGADLLLTHHPLIFSPLKRVVTSDFIGKRISTLIKNDTCLVAMHTNFDIMGMADEAADRLNLKHIDVLQLSFEDEIAKAGFGRTGELTREMTVREIADEVKLRFHIPTVKIFGDLDTICSRVAIMPGSGKSAIDDAVLAGVDVYITGDIDHHDGIDAVAKGLCIIDAGHYGVEKLFIDYLEEYINSTMKGISVKKAKYNEPFMVV